MRPEYGELAGRIGLPNTSTNWSRKPRRKVRQAKCSCRSQSRSPMDEAVPDGVEGDSEEIAGTDFFRKTLGRPTCAEPHYGRSLLCQPSRSLALSLRSDLAGLKDVICC